MKKLIFFVSLNFLIINCISIQFIYPQATPILLQGFPVLLDSIEETYNTGPIVEDFNNDGEKEILVGVNLFSAIGKVCLIDNKGNSFPNFPKLVSCVASYIWVAAGDINNDGYIDIVVKSDSLYVFDYLGNSLQGFPINPTPLVNSLGDYLSIYDLDNDKNHEIILIKKNVITVVNNTGSIRNGWPVTINQGANTSISYFAIGDLNNDNVAEIILPSSNVTTMPADSSKIFIFEPDGSQYSYSPIISDSGYYFDFWNYPIIYKNNNKNYFSIISNFTPNQMPNSYKSRFTTYNNVGQISVRKNFIPFHNTESLTMGRLENSEPFFLCGDVFFTYGFKNDGTSLTSFPLFIPSTQYRNHNIGKLTNEMCFVSSKPSDTAGGMGLRGYLKFWDINGQELSWSPLRTKGFEASAASFCDINNDGQAEVLVVTNGYIVNADGCGVYVWTLPGVSYSRDNFPWPMWGHDRYRTNQFGFVPPDEPLGIHTSSTIVPDNFNLYQNYPNPFNPSTIIKFDIRISSDVKLIIFDALGREIEILVNERLKPGSYSFNFDGNNYSSGVFLYTLKAGNYSQSKKMLLIK